MKKFYMLITIMVITMVIFSSKTGKTQSSDNYYIIRDSLEAYYNAHPEFKQEEDGEYTWFIRWKMFWEDRVYGGDPSKKGSFQLFREAAKNYVDNIDYYQRSTIIGSDWHCLGPDHITGPWRGLVSAIYVDTAADKNMNTIYIGTNASGIWKTTDGGLNWHNVTDPTGIPLLGIRDITGDPNNGNIIYAATGFFVSDLVHTGGIGIIKSTNGGVTWETLLSFQPDENKTVYKLLLDPYNSQRMYALIDTLLLRNNNAGVGTWDTLFKCTPIHAQHRNLRDIVMKPGDNTTLYVASDNRTTTWSYNLAKVYKIKNVTSSNLNDIEVINLDTMFTPPGDTIFTQRYQIAVTPADTSAIYVGCKQFPNDTTYKFTLWKYDNVKLWHKIIDFNNWERDINWDKISILVSPSDTGVVYLGGIRMKKYKYINGILGLDHEADGNIHADIRYAKIYKSNSGTNDIIFMGHDGGIGKTMDGLENCQNLDGDGLVITQFWGIGGANIIPDRIYAGSQDNNFFRYNNGNWTHQIITGDAGNPIVDYENPETFYFPGWGGGTTGVRRSTNGGGTASTIFDPSDSNYLEKYYYNIPLNINPMNHKSIYIGCHNLWKSITYGDPGTFSKISIPFPIDSNKISDPIYAFSIAPSDTSTIYVAFIGPYDDWGYQQPEKFIRTKDGGTNWTNLTNLPTLTTTFDSLLTYYGITSVEVSPTVDSTVWITFGGYWHEKDAFHHRVLLSNDGGKTWNTNSNYSAGLPNCPVNCIKYMKGGNDRLFVGTDMGVFYRDNTCSEWQPFNTGLPVCVVKDIEINDSTQKIRVGTYGRGIYETDLACDYNTTVWEIHSNITLNNDTSITQSILIDSSYTLTVKARLKLPPLARIFVQPGAKLIVDSGTLTNRCYNMWRGIEVRGHDLLKQNVLNQGYVNFKNGAVLENARIGVFTVGGFIIAENSTFRNNYNAVKFEGYAFNQASRFTKVTFETTRNYLDTNYAVPQDFVSLCDVAGVRFTGCTFKNTTDPDKIPGSLKGRGIYSMNATYYVDQHEYCPVQISPCPNPIYTPTEFKGLYYGIRVYNSDPTRYVQINNSIFDHNYRGIYLGSSNYSTLTQNKFLIPIQTQVGADTCYGLYLGTCSGYHVEDNNFTAPGNVLSSFSTTLREIGLIVDNSGGSPNEIYRNYFDTLDIAINAQRVNRQDGGAITLDIGGIVPYPIPIPTGLVLKCNTYNNNIYDEIATKGYLYGLEGIAKNQGAKTGSGKDQAGNTFSPYHDSVQIPESDIKNTADNIIYYHHIQDNSQGAPRVDPVYHTLAPSVLDTLVNNIFYYDTCCPSKLASPNPTPLDLRDVLSQEGTLINSLVNQLKDLVDDGNTDAMNDNIIYSAPPDALDVRQDLLDASPYLSDSVMKTAIAKESVLPNEMIRDVLVANPQSAKTDDVLNTLNDRFIPMPDSMMAEIMDGKDQLSPKEELEGKIALHAQYFMDAYNELVRYYLTDSIASESADSIIDFLESISDLDGKYLLAFEYLSTGDTTSMDNTLNSISSTYTLDRLRQQQYQDYLTYFSFLKSLYAQNKDILHIDSTQIALLVTLYNQTSEPVVSYVRNILIANNVINYFEPIIIPDDLKSTPEKNVLRTSHFSEGCYLKVFPNPAKHYIIVEYNTQKFASEKNEILLTITSFEGKILETRILGKKQDQQLIETVDYKPGIYLCFLKSGNKVLASRKFTIIQ